MTDQIRSIVLILVGVALWALLVWVYRNLAESYQKVRSKLRLLALVLRRAELWGRAEEELRRQQAFGIWQDARFSEESHRVSLASDVTEQRLLEALREARAGGLDLLNFKVLS